MLDNVRRQLLVSRKELIADVRSHGNLTLAQYLLEAGRDLADVYKNKGSWTALRREANLPTAAAGPDEEVLLRRMSAVAHVDDLERARVYELLASPGGAAYDELDETQASIARMLFFTLWPDKGGFASYGEGIEHLRLHPAVCSELRELVARSLDHARYLPVPVASETAVPLSSHAHYRREELLAAIGWASMDRSARGNITGVAWAAETGIDALMVNLRKTEKDFTPTTMYRDYAISPQLFHWESQNATSTGSVAGRRYLEHVQAGTSVLIFVRDTPEDELGASPFLCLGTAEYVEHRGEKPIEITWRLHRDMPGDMFARASVVAR